MHKITAKPITLDCFEIDDCAFIPDFIHEDGLALDHDHMVIRFIDFLEGLRLKYLETKEYKYWKELIRWLPESWLQTRTVTMNYENLLSMYHQRRFHKLDEWSGIEEDGVMTPTFVKFLEALPYANHFLAFLEIYNCDEVPLIDFS